LQDGFLHLFLLGHIAAEIIIDLKKFLRTKF